MSERVPPDPTEAAFRAAVRANPANALPRLVYADWLEERSDPRRRSLAEYIRLETELAGIPQDDPRGSDLIHRLIAVCERASHSLASGGASWWGSLARITGVQAARPLGGWEYQDDVARVRQKMRALRLADPSKVLFGVRTAGCGHGYGLKWPVREAKLLAFEAKLGFLLPADYRAFLLRIGNGPMGPHHGLNPLRLSRNPDPLRRPFPFTREQSKCAGSPISGPGPDDELLWFDEMHRQDGHLELSHHGCGMYDLLAVAGDTRGCMWFDGAGSLHLNCREDGETPETFLSWYENWLDGSLDQGALDHWRSIASRR